ncbi:hypothetical protein ACFE04_022773 [Oxalis oulophora]
MKLSLLIALRPISCFMLLVIVVLLPSSMIITSWFKMTKNIEHGVDENRQKLVSSLSSQFERTAKMLHPLNSSAIRLATLLNVNGSEYSFSEIQSKVAPALFNAFMLTPHISQISYVGVGGLFFSYYYIDSNQTLAMIYSNSTKTYNCYTQKVNPKTGILYGEPTMVKSSPQNPVETIWYHEALNSSTGYASLEPAYNNASESVFHCAASVESGTGVVGLGFSSEELTGFFKSIDLFGGSLYLAATDVKIIAGDLPKTDDYYSWIDVVGVKMVYALTFPRHWSSTRVIRKKSRVALILLILTVLVMVISILSFLYILIRAVKIEMNLRASLIKQMEATQQAERKNLNKTLAFASASHDIRSALIAIDASIDLSRNVSSQSELDSNLDQIKRCTKELGGLLKSVLDMSKIESGKMQLDEEEFDVAQLVEDAVDLYYSGGMKKGVDVILDLCDGSIMKFSKVKGDKAKLIQVLNNLLSNAIKFTSEGHITVRAWARKHKPKKVQLMLDDSNYNSHAWWFLEYFRHLFGKKNNNSNEDIESVNGERQNNSNVMEFVFEVDDTGKGIPREKRESVFENFVQVKETAVGLGGTGLGLGIVQSLVRLMGGEIEIVDKEVGKEGTCFQFNVYLTVTGTSFDDIFGSAEESRSGIFNLTMCSPVSSSSMHSSSYGLNFLSRKPEGSYVILLMQDKPRRRIVHKFIENLGISVSVVNQWESLSSTLNRLKSKWNPSHHSVGSSRKFEIISDTSSGQSKEVALSNMDGTEQRIHLSRRKGSWPNFLVLVIDLTAGPVMELQNVVADFRSGLPISSYKIIWLNKPTSGIDVDTCDPRDEVLMKPLHGLRLYHYIIKYFPEFGGNALQRSMSKAEKEKDNHMINSSYANKQVDLSPSTATPPPRPQLVHRGEIEEVEKFKTAFSSREGFELGQQSEIQQSSDLPLRGKRILVAEDNKVLREMARMILKKLGLTVYLCENGEEAVNLVRSSLEDQRPYDYILMDCQMPIKNGYEATSSIREEERAYGVHIPIIACTAEIISTEEVKKITECGMDGYLTKPLEAQNLMEIIRKFI